MKRIMNLCIIAFLLICSLVIFHSCRQECYHCDEEKFEIQMVKKEIGEGNKRLVCRDCAALTVTSSFDVAKEYIEKAGYSVSARDVYNDFLIPYKGIKSVINATGHDGNVVTIYYFENERYAEDAFENISTKSDVARKIVGIQENVVFVGTPDAIRAANKP